MQINLTVFQKHWCRTSKKSQPNVADEYKQILHVGKDDILICYLNFPNSFVLNSNKLYKVKKKKKKDNV